MVKKITICIMIFGLVFVSIPLFTKNVKAQENDIINLASPDLTSKEYLGNGIYRLINSRGLTFDYNVFNGVYKLNGTLTGDTSLYLMTTDLVVDNYSLQLFNYPNVSSGNVSYVISGGSSGTLYGGLNVVENQRTNINFSRFRLFVNVGGTFDNKTFRIQIEQGSTASAYQLPIGALEQHSQLLFNSGYNDGFLDGNIDGYEVGFNDGLDQAFNSNNLITSTDYTILERGQAGPHFDFFGLYFDNVNIKVKDIMLLNLSGTSLQNIDVGYSGSYQNITLRFTDNTSKTFYFRDYYDSFESLMLFNNDNDKLVKSITISLLATPSMSYPDFEALLNDYKRTLGLYLNNRILTDDAINSFKEIIENDLEIDYQNKLDNLLDLYLDAEFDKGYQKGINETDATGFSALLSTVFTGLGGLLAIELLPNIYIGSIIAIPLVFGIIFFILGKRKGD